MTMTPKVILSLVAIFLAILSYWPGIPTLPVAIIVLGVANLVP